MRRFSLAVLLFFVPLLVVAQSNPKNEIPFELLPSGHILVKATIDGVEGSFIFDTGAGITVFTKQFFAKLPHASAQTGYYTGFRATGERLDIDLFQVKQVELGNFKKAQEEVSWLDFNLGGIDGILSLKLLEGQVFTLDFTRKLLCLESKQSLAAIKKKARKVPVQLEQSRDKSLTLFTHVRVNDTVTLQVSLDSGAGKEVYRLNTRYMTLLKVDTNDTVNVKKIEKKSEINEAFVSRIYTTQLDKLAIAGEPAIATGKFPVQFVEGLIYDGILWINWLGDQITFDLDNKLLFVQR